MAAVSKINYRYFIYPTGPAATADDTAKAKHYKEKARLLQTAMWNIGTEMVSDIHQDNGSRFPVGTTFREQSQTMESVSPMTKEDMIYALANAFPYKITGDTWQFAERNGRIETGYTAPKTYHQMYLHGMADDTVAPSYVIATPTLNELELDIRREGETRMTQRWFGKRMEILKPKRDTPEPPYQEINVIQNPNWRVGVQYAEDGAFMAEQHYDNIIQYMIRFPELRQMVWNLNDSSFSFSDVINKASQPAVDLHVIADADASIYLERDGVYFVELSTNDDDFTWKMQTQITELASFEVEDDLWMTMATLTPFASFAPQAAASEHSITIDPATAGSKSGWDGNAATPLGSRLTASNAGYAPDNLNYAYYDTSDEKLHIGVKTDEKWQTLWPLKSVSIQNATGSGDAEKHELEYSSSEGGWISSKARTEDSILEAVTPNYKITFEYAWMPDKFLDIEIKNTGVTEL